MSTDFCSLDVMEIEFHTVTLNGVGDLAPKTATHQGKTLFAADFKDLSLCGLHGDVKHL